MIQPVATIIVSVAAQCGRAVRDVARESYALTLYTYWHLEQQRLVERWERASERFDLSGLVGLAMHKPAELHTQHERFLSEVDSYRVETAATIAARAARVSELATRIADDQRRQFLPVMPHA